MMVNNNIKELRQSKNLSQEQLAEKAGVSVRTVQRLESGNDGSIETLNLVAGALGVSVLELFPAREADDKVNTADNQLQYQLQRRREEYRTFKNLYTAIYLIVMLIVMLIWACFLGVSSNDNWSATVVILWIGAWILMAPLKRLLVINLIDPSLDRKYPLTKTSLDKDAIKKSK